MNFRQGLILLVISLFLVKTNAKSCPITGCTCSGTIVKCSTIKVFNNLTNGGSNNGFTYLVINSKDLKYIGDDVLPHNLTRIDINGVDNFTMSPNALKGSTNTLKDIRIQNGKRADFTVALRVLSSLSYFSVISTRVPRWDSSGLFKIGFTATTVVLNNLGLDKWPQWISQFHFLKTFEISNMPLQNMPENALNGLEYVLTDLKLNNDQLTGIPKAVTKLKTLKSLQMVGNQISNTHDLVYDLVPLELTLETLNVERNRLTELPRLLFLVKLKIARFNYNQINDSTSGSFPPSLTELHIYQNKLPSIPKVISQLPNLITVDLRNNGFSLVKKSDFPLNSSLSSLFLGVNPISSFPNDAFANLGRLKQLVLASTGITRVPLAIKSLVNLELLDLTDSKSLICTCGESSLKDYFALRPRLNVKGNCGIENVKHFFTTMVKSCP